MDLIYHISEYRDDTFYNDHTKIMYNVVQKSMVRYNNLLRRMCKDKFDDVDISVSVQLLMIYFGTTLVTGTYYFTIYVLWYPSQTISIERHV